MPLAQALAPLAAFRQFVVCRVDPSPRPGKTEKVPLDPRTLWAGDAQDPQNWLDAASAFALAEQLGPRFLAGFVITASDPFFCIDLDSCLQPDGQWSPVAQQLMQAFPGAAVELSDSGRGLHIWGCGNAPEHGKKNVAWGLEFYTELRFVALGRWAHATGNAGTDHTAMLQYLVPAYFPPLPEGEGLPADGPRADWRGPASDEDLLRRAMRSHSMASIGFGGAQARASFRDLWSGNVEILAASYPSTTGDAYDRSSADAALAQHLAFWTGCDAQRMERLMRQSALVRAKWDDRGEYYLNRTIESARARQRDVLTDALPAEPPGPPVSYDAPRPEPFQGSNLLNVEQQRDHFQGCVLVIELNRVLVRNGQLYSPEQFRAAYGGFSYVMDNANGRIVRDAWEAFTQNQVLRPPRADNVCFKPQMPTATILEEHGRTYVNTYHAPTIDRKVGDPTPFLVHLAKLLPDEHDRQILLSYMAAVVQHQGVKFQWAPVIQGVQGNGKSTLSHCVARAVGRHYTHWPIAKKLAARFNAWMANKVFYAVEDIYTPESASDIVVEELKPMITGTHIEIEGKGADALTREVCGNFMFNMNDKRGLRKMADDRRFAVFYTPQQSVDDLKRDGLDERYFERLGNWLEAEGYAIVAELLWTYPIPDAYNPARGCWRAPATSTTAEAIAMGMGSIEQEIMERVERGEPGFAGGWISSLMLERMLREIGRERALPLNRRRELLRTLGYDWHPALPDGRAGNHVISPDNGRPKLFARIADPVSNIVTASEALHHYVTSQRAAIDAAVKTT